MSEPRPGPEHDPEFERTTLEPLYNHMRAYLDTNHPGKFNVTLEAHEAVRGTRYQLELKLRPPGPELDPHTDPPYDLYTYGNVHVNVFQTDNKIEVTHLYTRVDGRDCRIYDLAQPTYPDDALTLMKQACNGLLAEETQWLTDPEEYTRIHAPQWNDPSFVTLLPLYKKLQPHVEQHHPGQFDVVLDWDKYEDDWEITCRSAKPPEHHFVFHVLCHEGEILMRDTYGKTLWRGSQNDADQFLKAADNACADCVPPDDNR